MKLRIEPHRRFEKWIARTMDNYKIIHISFDTYRERRRFLLKYQIKRMKTLIKKYEELLEET